MLDHRPSGRRLGTHRHVAGLLAATTSLGILASVAVGDLSHRTNRALAASEASALEAPPAPTEDPGGGLVATAIVTAAAIMERPIMEPPPAVPTTAATPAPPPAPPAGGTLKVAFLGDSVAKTTAAALQPMSSAYGVSIFNRGILGCGVVRTAPYRYFGQLYGAVPTGCESWPQTWRASVQQDRPDLAVVLVGRWELMDRMVGTRWLSIGSPEFDADVARSLDAAIAAAAAVGGRVVLATTPYYRRGQRPDGGTWPEDEPGRVDRFNALLREAAARHPGVAVVELGERLSVDGRLAMTIDGLRVRTDGVHVAPEAGPLLAPWLLPQLRALAGR